MTGMLYIVVLEYKLPNNQTTVCAIQPIEQ